MMTLDLDRRSYHVFEKDGDRLLFDRATGCILGIDEASFAVLSIYQANRTFEEALSWAGVRESEDREAFYEAFDSLKTKGFFKYEAVDLEQQDEIVKALLNHHPKRIQLLMAQGCNLGCRYCYAWRNGSNQKGTLMSFELAKASVNHLIKNSGPRTDLQVTFFGGEPLLNYEVLQQVVTYCRDLEKVTDKRFLFELITNGTLLDKEVNDYIVKEKFLLFISLDGWEEMHNYNRPSMSGTNEYQTILNNALYANAEYKKHGLHPVKVRANMTSRFHDDVRVGEYLAGLGFITIGIGPIEPLPHSAPSPSALTEDQMDELHKKCSNDLDASLSKLERGERLTFFESKKFHGAISQTSPRGLRICGVKEFALAGHPLASSGHELSE